MGHAIAAVRDAGRATDPGVGNIRNTTTQYWRRWLGQANRCLVHSTSFSEYDTIDGTKVPVWSALDKDQPLAFFAGIWTQDEHPEESRGEFTVDAYGF